MLENSKGDCIPNASVVANVSDSCLFVFCLLLFVCLFRILHIFVLQNVDSLRQFLKSKLLLLLLLFVFIPTIPLENSTLVNKIINIKGNRVTNNTTGTYKYNPNTHILFLERTNFSRID